MKKVQKICKQIEKANSEIESPKNIDFVEISMPNEELDKLAKKNLKLLEQINDPTLRKKILTKQQRLLTKIFKAASQVLTDKQYQVFVMKYVYGFGNREIAEQLGRNYSSRVLKACVKKIQRKLRIEENLTWLTGNYADEEK